ncbi:hypothetical protein JAAARDRAFT_68161 [Jaapia argillacea MUCL 33604]|uniref:BTB domain-containing protein n=1 Tax=Jaapia argillacea MUCL 33604 TaxID=933084 RepID=A0A067Q059_9AGAM|nr:hypothetical protein JAAARDRAFT_68161 [Jaapia argillacea MUCL 33604]
MPSSDSDGVSHPPLKRPRTEDSAKTQDRPPILRSDVWYDDGNIIVIAESTQFKVFKGKLSEASTIFQDMFLVSTPSTDDVLDGCPVIHISDSAEDVRHMLRAIHNWQLYPYQDLLPFAAVRAFLRMGKKYNIHYLWEDGRQPGDVWVAISSATLHDVIRLAWETPLLCVLPQALFSRCSWPTSWNRSFTGNLEKMDHCLPYPLRYKRDDILGGEIGDDGSSVKLSVEDTLRCVLGRERILEFQAKHSYGWLQSECISSSPPCTIAKLDTFGQLCGPPLKIRCPPGVLWVAEWDETFCSKCVAFGKSVFTSSEEALWKALPSFFDLPPWAELKAP